MTDVDVRQCVTSALRHALEIPEATEIRPDEAIQDWEPDGLSALGYQLDVEAALGLPSNTAPSILDEGATIDWLVAGTFTLVAARI